MRTLYFPLQAVLKTDDDLQLSSRFLSLFSFQGAVRRAVRAARTTVASADRRFLPRTVLGLFSSFSGFLRIQIPETNLS